MMAGKRVWGRVVGAGTLFKRTALSKRVVVLASALLVITIVTAVWVSNMAQTNTNDAKTRAINVSKIKNYVITNNCSDEAQKSVSKEQATIKAPQASIWLLNYQALCLSKEGKYAKANVIYEQLKHYYILTGDTADLANTNTAIASNAYMETHPIPKPVSGPPAVPPAEAKNIEKFLGSQH